jgi:hypothetical protein
MGDRNLLSRIPSCFGRHVEPLVSVSFAVVSTPVSRRVEVREATLSHDGKYVLSTPFSQIRVGE